MLRPRFSTQVMGEDVRLLGYRSSAVLPNNSPVRIAEGQIQRTRALAQASASLEACKQLHQVGSPTLSSPPPAPCSIDVYTLGAACWYGGSCYDA